MIKKYDNLDNNYLLGDGSVPIAINNAIPLEITDGEILTTLSLEDYNKIAFVVENDSTVNIDYLAMLGTQSSDSTIEIVKDVTASSGYALKLTGAQRIIFATKTSYIPDLLKKLTVKARCAPGNTSTLTASLVGYQDGNFINKDGAPLLTNYPKITLNEDGLTDSYATYVGFVSGVGSSYKEGTSTADAPSNMPIGTDEVAMILESSGGVFYVDVISLEEVPNSIKEIPEGTGVYNMVADISSDNRITPSEKQTFKMQYDSIEAEYPVILATATTRSLAGTDYTTAYNALVSYVASTGILDNLTVSTDITGSAFRAVVATYVEKKAKIQESINNFDASELTLSANSNVIDISARGTLKTTYIYLEVTTTIISLDNIVWSATDGTNDYSFAIIDLATPVIGQKRLDCALIASDSITITASITENGKTYTSTQAIAVVQPTVYDVVNFGMVTIEAPTETTDGEPLSKGDYFLWGGATTTTYTKGAIYEYTGSTWVESTNGDLVMTMFDSFADLANDVDDTVIGNAVIKKLVANKAFIDNLMTQDLEILSSLRAGYTPDGEPISENNGFWFSSSGKAILQNATIQGNILAGHYNNCCERARLTCSDDSGVVGDIVSDVTNWFANDLYIHKDQGAIAGTYEVMISSIDPSTTEYRGAFKWRVDGGSWSSNIILPLTQYDSIELGNSNIYINFMRDSNRVFDMRTVGDKWTFEAKDLYGFMVVHNGKIPFVWAKDGLFRVLGEIKTSEMNAFKATIDDLTCGGEDNVLYNTSGYVKLPNEMILQWSRFGATGDIENQPITFPMTFPVTCAYVGVTSNYNKSSKNGWDYARDITKSGCRITATIGEIRIFAIGW